MWRPSDSRSARFLHDAPDASFDHLTDICSADYPEDRQRFEVVYHLHSLSHHRRLRVKTRLSEGRSDDCLRDRRLEGRRVPRAGSLRHDGHPLLGPSGSAADFVARRLCGRLPAEKRFSDRGPRLAQPVRIHPHDWTNHRSNRRKAKSPRLRRKHSGPKRRRTPGAAKSSC